MNVTKPTILLLITNLGKGGAQRVFYDHALALSANYKVIEVVFEKIDERVYNTGFPIHYLKEHSLYTRLGPIGRLYNRSKNLKKLVENYNADIVISHMDGANWVNSLSFSKAKKIFVVHGTILYDDQQSRVMQWFRTKVIIPLLYEKSDIVVSVSEGIARELRSICSVKQIISIPNFFDIKNIRLKASDALVSEHKELFENYPVLITSGRLAKQKQQHCLFSIYKAVKKQHSPIRLVILGDGELRSSLISQAEALDLNVYSIWDANQNQFHNNYDVYFMGYVANPYQYLSKSKLFLFPSAWEGFPLALCEAMIAGAPVLTSDCPTGPREILAPNSYNNQYKLVSAEYTKNGVLLPLPNSKVAEDCWIEAILCLLNDPPKRDLLIKAARKKIQEFEKESVLEKWNSLISGLINE